MSISKEDKLEEVLNNLGLEESKLSELKELIYEVNYQNYRRGCDDTERTCWSDER